MPVGVGLGQGGQEAGEDLGVQLRADLAVRTRQRRAEPDQPGQRHPDRADGPRPPWPAVRGPPGPTRPGSSPPPGWWLGAGGGRCQILGDLGSEPVQLVALLADQNQQGGVTVTTVVDGLACLLRHALFLTPGS